MATEKKQVKKKKLDQKSSLHWPKNTYQTGCLSLNIFKCLVISAEISFHGKSLLTPNRNPTHNGHYLVDILVLTIG